MLQLDKLSAVTATCVVLVDTTITGIASRDVGSDCALNYNEES